MEVESKLSGKRLEQYYPKPYQDDKGRWWFYDPEIGWMCKELQDKINEAFLPEDNFNIIEGRLIFFGTSGDINDNKRFKDLWK